MNPQDFLANIRSRCHLDNLDESFPELTITPEELILGAHAAVVKVAEYGAAVLERRLNGDFGGVSIKDDKSPVTGLDLYVSERAAKDLCLILPGPVITEENINQLRLDSSVLARGRWILDPIDGTKGILKSQDLSIEEAGWGISAAYVVGDTPVLGIIGIPRMGKVFFGIAGHGAYEYEVPTGNFSNEPISTPLNPDRPKRAAIASTFSETEWARTLALYEKNGFEESDLKSVSSIVKFALFAKGEFDAAGAPRSISSWDLAAAVIFVRELGGELYDLETARPIKLVPGDELRKLTAGYIAVRRGLTFNLTG